MTPSERPSPGDSPLRDTVRHDDRACTPPATARPPARRRAALAAHGLRARVAPYRGCRPGDLHPGRADNTLNQHSLNLLRCRPYCTVVIDSPYRRYPAPLRRRAAAYGSTDAVLPASVSMIPRATIRVTDAVTLHASVLQPPVRCRCGSRPVSERTDP